MQDAKRWYERERWAYVADRKIADAYADWIRHVPWRLFCTFTFAWRVSDQQAIKTFVEFINRLEHHLNCDVGYVRGDEKRFSGCGKPACARHFHVLMTFVTPVSPKYVEAIWKSMAGNRSDNAGAKVEVYDPDLNGESYVLKFINRVDGDWAFRKLHLFHPQASVEMLGKRVRRHLRRHPALLQQCTESHAP
jgi:hypothetical protein